MIQPSIFNCLNFTDDFNRTGNGFDANLQRVTNLFSKANGYLSFVFTPDTMPGTAPAATLIANFDDGNTGSFDQSGVVSLETGYVYFFKLSFDYNIERNCYFQVLVAGYDDVIFSERSLFIPEDNLMDAGVVRIIASNNQDANGYLKTYPACGFFEVSKLNESVFGNSKVEYKYSYGRTKILNSENYIKTRLTFCNLSMYQRNLLQFLCNCENLTINGVGYYLVSELTEKNKDENYEVCDLQADFVLISDPTFYATGSTGAPSKINPTNLFING